MMNIKQIYEDIEPELLLQANNTTIKTLQKKKMAKLEEFINNVEIFDLSDFYALQRYHKIMSNTIVKDKKESIQKTLLEVN